jgi:hypothetical protein
MKEFLTGEWVVDKGAAKPRRADDSPRERPGSEWLLVSLALASGMLVAFGLKCLRQPMARVLLPGRVAYDLAGLVMPRLPDEPPPRATAREP